MVQADTSTTNRSRIGGRLSRSWTGLALLATLHVSALLAALASARPHDLFDPRRAPRESRAPLPPVVTALAPIVYLHPDEEFLPDDPNTFLQHAHLRWAHDEMCFDHLVTEHVDAAALGAGGYRHRHSTRHFWECRHHGRGASSAESVRPRTRESGEEGFFLDLIGDAARNGIGTGAPVLFYYLPKTLVAYWFFYDYNDGGPMDHEGDWENVVVHLDADEQPTEVAYYAHGGASVYPWDGIGHEGTHPVVYSARGSHASYPQPGTHYGIHNPDHAAAGARWDTGTNLRNVALEPWWGYGGAWGEVGEIASTTGPKGPSPFKLSVPPAWVAVCNAEPAPVSRQ